MQTVSPQLNLSEIDERVLKFWQVDQTFKKSLDLRKDADKFLFYDGPPFASGLPHYGHLLVGTMKDIIPRYQTMLGKSVDRRFGWDTHGLPIEMIIEKELGLKGRTDILEYGVDRYNEACRSGVLRYVDEWGKVTNRLGRWVDFQNDYKTMDPDFMESVWWVFKQLWEAGKIYEGTRCMPYSWRLATPLSNFEASSNYKMVQDPAITVAFKLKESPDTSFLAWTTTPWTLPANFALCLNPEITYLTIKSGQQKYILAEARLENFFKKDQVEILKSQLGSELFNIAYEPLLPYFASEQKAFYTLNDSYVTTQDGTGIVHIAPAHGEDDHRLGLANNLPVIDPTDAEGNFKLEVTHFAGQNIKEADKGIIQLLKDEGKLFKLETIDHSYPFCERSNTPLIYKTISAWYVKVEELRGEMLKNNAEIHWVPDHIKDGRFGKWLEQARDWNISRNRFWGNPLPIWKCDQENCDQMECLGSRSELETKTGQTVADIHKHFVDQLTWKCTNCSTGQMRRIPEVLDCWFESGAMPYAQQHYPFANKETFETNFPADFIIESLDQTRGWFYTLMVLSSSVFKKAPFKNCIVTGMVLAEDGKKMSKSLKNYPDPTHVLDQYGADALRLYLINSPLLKGESLRFSERGVKEIIRSVFLPFWNVYSFFTTYANVDNYQPSATLTESKNSLDTWILSRFQSLLNKVEAEMKVYQVYNVVPCLLEFLEDLTNWYLRRSRRRFWSDNLQDKQDGYDTLYYILVEFSKTLAPFLPFLTEEIYQNLRSLEVPGKISIHLQDYPQSQEKFVNSNLESQMELIKLTVSLGRSLRSNINIRTRQPLASITVVTKNQADAETLKSFSAHIKEELNVKEVLFSANEQDLVEIEVKPDFPTLGPIFGKEMKALAGFLKNLSGDDLAKLERGEEIEFMDKKIPATALDLRRKPKAKDLQIETARGVTVFYETKLTLELLEEGLAREFVNRVQKMRKDAGFEISDRIQIAVDTKTLELTAAITSNLEYIKSEVLATEILSTWDSFSAEATEAHQIEEYPINIAISR